MLWVPYQRLNYVLIYASAIALTSEELYRHSQEKKKALSGNVLTLLLIDEEYKIQEVGIFQYFFLISTLVCKWTENKKSLKLNSSGSV